MTQEQADAAVRGIPTNEVLAKHASDDAASKAAIFDALARRVARKAERKAAQAA